MRSIPPLRRFQQEELKKLLTVPRAGITWDMGLGKTAAASILGAERRLQRWLIICPDNALSVWGGSRHLEQLCGMDWVKHYWPQARIHVEQIVGEPWWREKLWSQPYVTPTPDDVHVKIVTWGTFLRDWRHVTKTGLKGRRKEVVSFRPHREFHIPEILIYDECRPIRNRDTQMFKVLQRWMNYYSPPYFYPMTGTPGHEPKHFWTLLNLLAPKDFPSYWQFIKRFHQVDDGWFGQEVNEPINQEAWHKLLRRYFSVIREDDPGIADERPPITRQLLPISMEADQHKVYSDLKNELLHFTPSGNMIIAPNEFALVTRLRQCLVCPRILADDLGVGAAIKDFAQTVEPEEHNVIFTPFKEAQEHFKVFLEARGFKHVHLLHGGMGSPDRDRVLADYRFRGGTVICTTLYAQAFSLEPATRSYAIGYDWDPDHNRQAEKRLHRLTTQNPITSYYYTFHSTFDERLCEIVNLKQERVNWTFPDLHKELTTKI